MQKKKKSSLTQFKRKYFIGQPLFHIKKKWSLIFSISKLFLCMPSPQGAFCPGQKTECFLTSMYVLNYTNKQHISCEVRLHWKRLLQLKENASCLHSVKMDYHLSCYLAHTIQGTLAVLTRITVPICSLILVCMLPTVKYS